MRPESTCFCSSARSHASHLANIANGRIRANCLHRRSHGAPFIVALSRLPSHLWKTIPPRERIIIYYTEHFGPFVHHGGTHHLAPKNSSHHIRRQVATVGSDRTRACFSGIVLAMTSHAAVASRANATGLRRPLPELGVNHERLTSVHAPLHCSTSLSRRRAVQNESRTRLRTLWHMSC